MMQDLHLIVHEDILRKELRETNPTIERQIHLMEVLDRLDYIHNNYRPHVKDFTEGLIPKAFPLCEGYNTIFLYGCTRKLCLGMIANGLVQRSYRVAFDIEGTTD